MAQACAMAARTAGSVVGDLASAGATGGGERADGGGGERDLDARRDRSWR